MNASRNGALIESASRLLPGHRCTIQWQGSGLTTEIPGRVVRSEVSRLDADHLSYLGAIEFEQALADAWEAATLCGHEIPEGEVDHAHRRNEP